MDQQTLQSRIHSLGRRLRSLVQALQAAGYKFDEPDDVLPGPDSKVAEAILRIEGSVGTLPLALKLFWLHIGNVNLSGHHPDWIDCEFLDQLIVFPPMYALYELEEFLFDQEERVMCGIPYAVPIAPDLLHKAGVSGGSPYALAVPATADDPLLENASRVLSFLGHIEHALDYAGFAGSASCPHHNWPIAKLLSANEA